VDAYPVDQLKAATRLCKQGQSNEGLALVRELLRRGRLSAEQIDRVGRLIQKELSSAEPGQSRPLRVVLLGQFTTSWLATALTAVAWGCNAAVQVSEGGYDTIAQDLSRFAGLGDRPDVVVLLPWNQRLLGSDLSSQAVEDELGFWRQAWRMIQDGLGSRVLQLGYDWVVPGARGSYLDGQQSGRVQACRAVNLALRQQMPEGAYFLDLELVSGGMGRDSFYDMRRYYWTKQPFGEEGTHRLATQLWAGIRALTTGPKKFLVLDLDNTLWGGVVGETGPLGVALGDSPDGEAFRAFQSYVKDLARRGIVLAVASKNNPEDAREVFEKNPDMVLRLDDFAAFEACWDPKAVSIGRIAETLSLGLDSFVFFDDNPAEGELIRQTLPDVEVVDVPADPAEYIRALQAGGWFETTGLTRDDEARVSQYAVERKRRELQHSFTSLDDYLRSLEIWGDLRDFNEEDLLRVVQLLAKTNQFNLTTRRHSREQVLDLVAQAGSIAWTLRVQDRFGDYGLVSVLIGVPAEEPDAVRIDTWLMSCRVIGRTVEQFLFVHFVKRSLELGYSRILGEYIPTKKNALVAELYERLGFSRLTGGDDSSIRYELILNDAEPPETFVSARQSAVLAEELVAS
jgi:FkbH-like protein